MEEIKTIGVDLAKEIFHLHCADKEGRKVKTLKLKRKDMLPFFINLKPCFIGMESCGGSNYWARKLKAQGHNAKIMQAKFVKPFVKSNKDDHIDAEAICEAVARPNMRFAPSKEIWQQDIQTIHRIRERLIGNKVALSNSMRGLLMEYGITIPKGHKNLKSNMPLILEDAENELTDMIRKEFSNLYEEFKEVEKKIAYYDKEIDKIYSMNEKCQKIGAIPGVGPITATIVMAQIGNGRDFKNGRQYAAYLGLVPRHTGTGGKTINLGISKRGDKYIRAMMIHGSRSVMKAAYSKSDQLSTWAKKTKERRGFNRTCVALANKKARVIWAVLARDTEYRAN